MNRLTLTISPDGDGTAELFARVEAEGFAGAGSAWFNIDELASFCASLGAYPIDPHSPPVLEGGVWDRQDPNLRETHLAIRIVPFNNRGALRVDIHLEDQRLLHERAHPRRSVSTWLVASYEDLGRFRASFTGVLSGNANEAILTTTID